MGDVLFLGCWRTGRKSMDLFIIMLFTFCQSTVFSIPTLRLLFNGIVIYIELVGMETNWTLEAVLSSSAA